MNFINNYKIHFLFLLLGIIISSGSIFIYRHSESRPAMAVNFNTPEKQIIVDIRGAVNNPGLYTLTWGQSVEDVVGYAGGFTADAVASSELLVSIPDNLDYIYIPSKNDGPQKVNINYAEQWLLEALPGIGAAKAKAIMDYRTNNGYFTNVSEIKKVSGIGDTIFNQIKDRITI